MQAELLQINKQNELFVLLIVESKQTVQFGGGDMWRVLVVLLLMSSAIKAQPVPGDIDGDGLVAFGDFLILAANFGKAGTPGGFVRRDTVYITKRDTFTIQQVVRDTITVETPPQKEQRLPQRQWTDVVKDIQKSIYWIGIEPGASPLIFIGTGFSVSPWSIATNAHVAFALQNALDDIHRQGFLARPIIIQAGTSFYAPTTLALQTSQDGALLGYAHPLYQQNQFSPDIALLAPEKPMAHWVTLGKREVTWEMAAGQEIGTLGFPGELDAIAQRTAVHTPTFSVGTISAMRTYESWAYTDAYTTRIVQFNLNLTGGTSGSPIFNQRGEVLAVNSSGFRATDLSFGVRSDELRNLNQYLSWLWEFELPNTKPAVVLK